MATRWLCNLVIGLLLCLAPGCSDSEPPAPVSGADTDQTSSAPVDKTPTNDTATPDTPNPGLPRLTVTIKGETFNLELAMDDDSRLQGLSDRAEIAPDGGMLFVFPDAQRREFVMRRCLVPINLAFLSDEGEIVWMHAMQVEPKPNAPDYQLKRYKSHHPARFAIEVRDGTLRRLGLQQGDRIELPLDDLKARAR